MLGLIVLGNLGTNNSSQTAYNIVYDIYRFDIPLIVTISLSPAFELNKPDTSEKKTYMTMFLRDVT